MRGSLSDLLSEGFTGTLALLIGDDGRVTILEEVVTLLTIEVDQSYSIGSMDTITQEFQTKSR